MATNTPFDRLIGPLTIYVAPVGEAFPDVSEVPAGNWGVLGPTDGGQTLTPSGALEYLRDDDHTGPVKAYRPEEDLILAAMLVGLTLENYEIALNLDAVATEVGPPAIKSVNLKRGFFPDERAVVCRGEVQSPYGLLPAQYLLPRGVFDGEPEIAHTKEDGAGIEFEYHVLEDDTQAAGKEMGWIEAQTA